jgi:hypothetical protein
VTDPDADVCEQVVAAPPEEVFRWLIDPDLLARWIGIRPGSLASFLGRRVEGDARRLYRLADPLMALLVHRSVQRDLRTLRRLLENGTEPPVSPG